MPPLAHPHSHSQALYALQDAVFALLAQMQDPQFAAAKLCGGTALARFWLHHRVSWDLDFFLPEGFNATRLASAIKSAGIKLTVLDLVDGLKIANQLHGTVSHNGSDLKVSFIEDAYYDLYPALERQLGGVPVKTEPIEGLYHRKLRTVSGHVADGEQPDGGRQAARDLFDLYVLSRAHSPILEFMQTLPYEFPKAAFCNGIASMPWFDLMQELGEIDADARWHAAKDIEFLQNALFDAIGATTLAQPSEDEPTPAPDTAPTSALQNGLETQKEAAQ